MTDDPTPGQTVRRYALFQIPGALLGTGVIFLIYRWTALPGWAAAALIAVWLLKDAALYPWLRSAYETNHAPAIDRLVGLTGVATEPLTPHGYVRVRGELWRAEPVSPTEEIGVGRAVTVDGVRGTTLLVRADPAESPPETQAARGQAPITRTSTGLPSDRSD